ncbi:MAG: hypothetical protein RLY58_2150 [Pseudomonadota bacterium]|jgi:hypothetical protein
MKKCATLTRSVSSAKRFLCITFSGFIDSTQEILAIASHREKMGVQWQLRQALNLGAQ